MNDKNTKNYTVEYRQKGTDAWTQAATGSVYSYDSNMILNINASPDASYDLRLSVKDFFGTTIALSEVATAFTLISMQAAKSWHLARFQKKTMAWKLICL